jgi:hypothetical protein
MGMSATALERPRPIVAPRDAPAMAVEAPPPRQRPGRRVGFIALAISVFLHILVLALRFDAPAPTPAAPGLQVLNAPAVQSMQVFNVVVVQAEVPTPQVVVEPRATAPIRPDLAPPPTDIAPTRAAEAPTAAAADPLTVRERLTPQVGDPRLFNRPADPLSPTLEPMDNVRARVYAALEAYNDSMAGAAADAARAMDWTVKDANGGRWGVSPGQLHLGSISLPLPFGFQVPPGRRDEYNERLRVFNETQQQARRAEAEKGFKERVNDIRARKDAQRDSTRRGGGGG